MVGSYHVDVQDGLEASCVERRLGHLRHHCLRCNGQLQPPPLPLLLLRTASGLYPGRTAVCDGGVGVGDSAMHRSFLLFLSITQFFINASSLFSFLQDIVSM